MGKTDGATDSAEKVIRIAGSITVDELAQALGLAVTTLIGELFKNGIVATINQRLDFETAEIMIQELGMTNVRLERKNTASKLTYDRCQIGAEEYGVEVVGDGAARVEQKCGVTTTSGGGDGACRPW